MPLICNSQTWKQPSGLAVEVFLFPVIERCEIPSD